MSHGLQWRLKEYGVARIMGLLPRKAAGLGCSFSQAVCSLAGGVELEPHRLCHWLKMFDLELQMFDVCLLVTDLALVPSLPILPSCLQW